MTTKIYYVHDPMCSWCWAFRPALEILNQTLKTQTSGQPGLEYLLGGLARDTDELMPDKLQEQIKNHWRSIQKRVPATEFNYDFWQICQPRRSTYPACRAVLAAKFQANHFEESMIKAIQHAYYLQARNPSNTETLIELADEIGLDIEKFRSEVNSEETKNKLELEIQFARQIGGNAFPMLLLAHDNDYHQILIDYNRPDSMLAEINRLI